MSALIRLGGKMRGAGARAVLEGEVVAFPARGNAQLASFAAELRNRFACRSPVHDPFLFSLSRRPVPRLAIDRAASVELCGDRAAYRVAIAASADTTVTVETFDFDTVADFVGQYIAARLSEPTCVEETP
jgi:hypothetical protein